MKQKLKLMGIAFAAITMLVSCYPKESLNYSDLDVAVTNYDDTVDFSNVKEIFFLDTVMHIVGIGEDKPTKPGPYDDFIKSTVLQNIKKTGLASANIHVLKDTLDIPAGITPDLVVTISVMETDYYNYWSYPWYGYWGYWGWGWYYKSGSLKSANESTNSQYYYNPWYPWYPSYGVSYSYTIGSVNIDMVNYKAADLESEFLPIAWTGVANGMRSNSAKDEKTRIATQIEQCFSVAQSPYLY